MKSIILFGGMLIATAAQAFPNPSSNVTQEYQERMEYQGPVEWSTRRIPGGPEYPDDLCAILYEHWDFQGKSENIYSRSRKHEQLNLDNQVSSIHILSRCSLRGYRDKGASGSHFWWQGGYDGKKVLRLHRNNDVLSSVYCTCCISCSN